MSLRQVLIYLAGGGGAPNWLARVTSGTVVQSVLLSLISRVTSGVSVSQAPTRLTVDVKPGVAVTTSARSTTRVDAATGISANQRNSAEYRAPVTLGAEILQVVDNLVRRVGGNVAALTTTGTQGWTNPNNAVSGTNGRRDGVSASYAGNLTAARQGRITLDYPNHVDKGNFTVSSVKIFFYLNTASTLANNANVVLGYNIGAGDVTLQTITGDVTNLTTPLEFDLTAAVIAGGNLATIWARLDALKTYVNATSAAAQNWTVTLDAIEVEIVASQTINL